jgi:hypothetical protein
MQITVKHNQDVSDVALLVYGNAEKLFETAAVQSISITDDLLAGEVLLYDDPDLQAAQRRISELLARPMNIPASADAMPMMAGITGTVVLVPMSNNLPGEVVRPKQCLVDMAMQHLGNTNDLFGLAASLGFSMTEALTAGDRLLMPGKELTRIERALNVLLNRAYNIPASDMDADGPPQTEILEGIDYWYVWEYVVR